MKNAIAYMAILLFILIIRAVFRAVERESQTDHWPES